MAHVPTMKSSPSASQPSAQYHYVVPELPHTEAAEDKDVFVSGAEQSMQQSYSKQMLAIARSKQQELASLTKMMIELKHKVEMTDNLDPKKKTLKEELVELEMKQASAEGVARKANELLAQYGLTQATAVDLTASSPERSESVVVLSGSPACDEEVKEDQLEKEQVAGQTSVVSTTTTTTTSTTTPGGDDEKTPLLADVDDLTPGQLADNELTPMKKKETGKTCGTPGTNDNGKWPPVKEQDGTPSVAAVTPDKRQKVIDKERRKVYTEMFWPILCHHYPQQARMLFEDLLSHENCVLLAMGQDEAKLHAYVRDFIQARDCGNQQEGSGTQGEEPGQELKSELVTEAAECAPDEGHYSDQYELQGQLMQSMQSIAEDSTRVSELKSQSQSELQNALQECDHPAQSVALSESIPSTAPYREPIPDMSQIERLIRERDQQTAKLQERVQALEHKNVLLTADCADKEKELNRARVALVKKQQELGITTGMATHYIQANLESQRQAAAQQVQYTQAAAANKLLRHEKQFVAAQKAHLEQLQAIEEEKNALAERVGQLEHERDEASPTQPHDPAFANMRFPVKLAPGLFHNLRTNTCIVSAEDDMPDVADAVSLPPLEAFVYWICGKVLVHQEADVRELLNRSPIINVCADHRLRGMTPEQREGVALRDATLQSLLAQAMPTANQFVQEQACRVPNHCIVRSFHANRQERLKNLTRLNARKTPERRRKLKAAMSSTPRSKWRYSLTKEMILGEDDDIVPTCLAFDMEAAADVRSPPPKDASPGRRASTSCPPQMPVVEESGLSSVDFDHSSEEKEEEEQDPYTTPAPPVVQVERPPPPGFTASTFVPPRITTQIGYPRYVSVVSSDDDDYVHCTSPKKRFRLRRKKSKSLAAFAPKMERREEEITDSLSVVQKAMRTALDTPDRVQARICGEIGGPYERSSSSDESEFEFKDDGEAKPERATKLMARERLKRHFLEEAAWEEEQRRLNQPISANFQRGPKHPDSPRHPRLKTTLPRGANEDDDLYKGLPLEIGPPQWEGSRVEFPCLFHGSKLKEWWAWESLQHVVEELGRLEPVEAYLNHLLSANLLSDALAERLKAAMGNIEPLVVNTYAALRPAVAIAMGLRSSLVIVVARPDHKLFAGLHERCNIVVQPVDETGQKKVGKLLKLPSHCLEEPRNFQVPVAKKNSVEAMEVMQACYSFSKGFVAQRQQVATNPQRDDLMAVATQAAFSTRRRLGLAIHDHLASYTDFHARQHVYVGANANDWTIYYPGAMESLGYRVMPKWKPVAKLTEGKERMMLDNPDARFKTVRGKDGIAVKKILMKEELRATVYMPRADLDMVLGSSKYSQRRYREVKVFADEVRLAYDYKESRIVCTWAKVAQKLALEDDASGSGASDESGADSDEENERSPAPETNPPPKHAGNKAKATQKKKKQGHVPTKKKNKGKHNNKKKNRRH